MWIRGRIRWACFFWFLFSGGSAQLILPSNRFPWIHIGVKEDILLLWDIDLQPEPESSQWFYDRGPVPLPPPLDDDMRRYSPEQYLWRTLLAKFGPVQFEYRGDICDYNIRLTELTFANNLIILDLTQFPLVVHKYPLPLTPWFRYYRFLSHNDWQRLYQEYSVGDMAAVRRLKLVDPNYYLKRSYMAAYAPWSRLRALARTIAEVTPRTQQT